MSVDQLLEWMRILLATVGVLLCAILVWAVFSAFPFGLRWALDRVGFGNLLKFRRLLRLRRLFGWPLAAYGRVRQRLDSGQARASVRVVIDERLVRLKATMLRTRDAVRRACQTLDGVGGRQGPAQLVADVNALSRRSEEIANLGGEIDEELLKSYAAHARASTNLAFGLFFGAAFALGNGILLNQFFRDLFAQYFAGVPVSVIFSVLVVIFEMGLGWLIAIYSSPTTIERYTLFRWALIGLVCMLALVEATIFGTLSYGFEIDLALFRNVEWTRYWLAPLGLVFVTTTSGVGYAVHQLLEETAAHSGSLRLKREITAANTYVRSLPQRWEQIGRRAREAEAAIDAYVSALGGQAGALSGAVEQIRSERDDFLLALVNVKVDDWRQVVEGTGGDDRRDSALNVGLCFLTLAGVGAYWWALAQLFAGAFVSLDRIPQVVWTAAALFLSLAVYALGNLPFQRLHYNDGTSGRVYPFRTGAVEYGVATGIGLVAAVALIWASVLGFGWRGVFIGLLFVAGGGLLVVLGYFAERFARGGMLTGSVLAACLAALGAVLVAIGVNFAAWLLAAVYWLFWWVLTIGGAPILLAIWAYGRWKLRPPPPPRRTSTIAPEPEPAR